MAFLGRRNTPPAGTSAPHQGARNTPHPALAVVGGHSSHARHSRVAMYSQGLGGFGHIRRNALIAQALQQSALQPVIVLFAEAWQAGVLPMPGGVDCVTLPAARGEPDGSYRPRFLDMSEEDLVALRSGVIRSAVEAFEPDVLLVEQWPLGAARELTRTLPRARQRGRTRCVLGLRDVLYDRETTRRAWADAANLDAIRDFYDAVWVYGDPAVCDAVRGYDLPDDLAARVRYTGYLDQRPRLEVTRAQAAPLLASLPPGRIVLCVVGSGHGGGALAEAFFDAQLPPDAVGVVVTGPLMSRESRERVRRSRPTHSRFVVLDFVPEAAPLIERADRVIAMGGYNTVCEVLSLEKPALIVPKVSPELGQWIRAQRLRELGLLEVLHPEELSSRALSEWLARDPAPPRPSHTRIDFGGLDRMPLLLAELLSAPAGSIAASRPVSAMGLAL